MRKANHADAELLLKLYEMRRDPELRRARRWFLTDFKPGAWSDIKARYLSHDDEDRWFRMTTSYWELVGTLLSTGVLHPEMFFDHTGEDIVSWDRCKSWIADARADLRPTYLWRFEEMVVAHQAYRVKTVAAVRAQAERAARPRAKRRKR
jgi:inorganic triphosphatase YgiF